MVVGLGWVPAAYAGLGEGLCKASTVVDRCVDSQPGGPDGCFVVAPDAWETAFLRARPSPCGGSGDKVYVPGNPSEASRINGLTFDDAEAACVATAALPGPLFEACVFTYSLGARGVAVASTTEVHRAPLPCYVSCRGPVAYTAGVTALSMHLCGVLAGASIC